MTKFMEEENLKNKNNKQKMDRSKDEEKNILEVKYVFTNPLKHVKLKSDDLVFVLAQQDPGATADTWDDYKEFKEQNGSINNFQNRNEKGRQIDEIREQMNNIQDDGFENPEQENLVSNQIRTLGKKREFEEIIKQLTEKIGTLRK